MTKKNNKPVTQASSVTMERVPGESDEATIARYMLLPSLQASQTLLHWVPLSLPVDANALVQALGKESEQASAGNLSRGEAMLMSQAHALDGIFNSLAVLSRQNLSQNVEVGDTLLRLALRAQTQCRATIETLAEIKNPTSATFVRQANIAHGPQQVNNAPQTPVARAKANDIPQTKLLEQSNGERLDIGSASQAVDSDPAMATVGAIDGTTHG